MARQWTADSCRWRLQQLWRHRVNQWPLPNPNNSWSFRKVFPLMPARPFSGIQSLRAEEVGQTEFVCLRNTPRAGAQPRSEAGAGDRDSSHRVSFDWDVLFPRERRQELWILRPVSVCRRVISFPCRKASCSFLLPSFGERLRECPPQVNRRIRSPWSDGFQIKIRMKLKDAFEN